MNKDSINLQKLLYDGKILAEQKIMEIHNCLGTLQETLQKMGSSVTGMARIPESRSGILLPDGFYQNTQGRRCLLTIPLDAVDTPKYYGPASRPPTLRAYCMTIRTASTAATCS